MTKYQVSLRCKVGKGCTALQSVSVTQAYLILVHILVYEYLSHSIDSIVLKDVISY